MGTPALPYCFNISVISGSPFVQSAFRATTFRFKNSCLTCGVSMAKRSLVLQVIHQSAVKSTKTGLPAASASSSVDLLKGRQISWLGLVTNPYEAVASRSTKTIETIARARERAEEIGVQKDPLIHARIAITRRIAPS